MAGIGICSRKGGVPQAVESDQDMRSKIIGAMLALIGLAVVANCVPEAAAPLRAIEITPAALDSALSATLAQGREVDFPEKTRFEALRFRHAAGLGFEGRARFVDPATGTYPPPDITFFGSVPLMWWSVEAGSLTIKLASVDGIGPIPGRPNLPEAEAERIRDSLGTGLGTLMSRMSFPTGLDPNRVWVIANVQSTPEALRFELLPR